MNDPTDFLPVFKKPVHFNHNPKLPRSFRMIITGSSGGGKSVLLSKMLLYENFFDINRLYYFSRTLKEQGEMHMIIYAFNKGLHKDHIVRLFKEDITEDQFQDYADEIAKRLPQRKQIEVVASSKITDFPLIDDLDKTRKNLIVIDDFQNNMKVGEVAENYFNNARKYNCNMIYIGQRFMSVPKDVRSSANFIVGFNQQKRDSDWFYSDILSRFIDKEDFKRLITKEWKTNPETGHSGYVAVNQETGALYTNLFS